ncbi:hypothetical protein jhhlp_008703 [Lomentospora prolificans]|uniref:Phospholipase/carboxylesterase/thioesterase domain-containing protein n=1 Tax=Lomentospora prolificans TaxID=41688 RepID=A0A2N3MYS7_9PEZI|nr:hypothetical protein jhhlp_008703 [Lomentospora prolificans]
MAPKIPTDADFTSLEPNLHLAISFPSPPESTTTFLILFHGFGDNESSFINFARAMNLPSVTAIAVRGPSVLPPSLLPDPSSSANHFHWGDDVNIDPSTGDIDADPGFERAKTKVLDTLIRGLLITKLGWEMDDIILFGFGQGGSFALGLAAAIANPPRLQEIKEEEDPRTFKGWLKGVVSIGGPLPLSMVSTLSARKKSNSRVLLVQVTGDDVEATEREFESVKRVKWHRSGVDMPRKREEMLPIMAFLAEALSPQHSFGR